MHQQIPRTLKFLTFVFACAWVMPGCERQSRLEKQLIEQAMAEVDELPTIRPEQLGSVVKGLEGDVVLVAFWSTDSSISMQHLSRTMSMAEIHYDRGLQLITIGMDAANNPSAAQFLGAIPASTGHNVRNFASAFGGAEVAYQQYEITDGLPHFQLFDRAGKLAATYRVAGSELNERIESLLALDFELTGLMDAANKIEAPTTHNGPPIVRPLFDDADGLDQPE